MLLHVYKSRRHCDVPTRLALQHVSQHSGCVQDGALPHAANDRLTTHHSVTNLPYDSGCDKGMPTLYGLSAPVSAFFVPALPLSLPLCCHGRQ